MSINPRATVDRMRCRYLANLGVMVSVDPVHVARGAWTWRFTNFKREWLFDIDVAERSESRSRDVAVQRAIAMVEESR